MSPLFGSDPLYLPLQLSGINSSAGYALSLNTYLEIDKLQDTNYIHSIDFLNHNLYL